MALTKPTSKQIRIKDVAGTDKLLSDLGTSAGASMVGYLPAGASAVATVE